MNAAHQALIWGYRILEKAFLPEATFADKETDPIEVDEETSEILQLADLYASSGKRTIAADTPTGQLPVSPVDLKEPLLSIFPELFLHPQKRTEDDEEKKGTFCVLPQLLLGKNQNYPVEFPDDSNTLADLQIDSTLKAEFLVDAKAFNLIETNGSIKSDLGEASADKLLLMLEKYGTWLPSKVQYVPLFDYFRIVSAFAACLEKGNIATTCEAQVSEGETENRFLLVCGDLSGIQDFVYGISSKGALKSLRARSFFLEFAMEHVLTRLIEMVGVSRANVIYRGGGNFFLLLPNLPLTMDAVDKLSKAMNRWFHDRFEGCIYLAMGTVAFDAEAILWDEAIEMDGDEDESSPFARFWQEGFELLETLKQRKFSELLHTELFKQIEPVDPFDEDTPPTNENECQICHREDMPGEEAKQGLFDDQEDMVVCIECYHLFHLGDGLTDFHYILRLAEDPEKRGTIRLPDENGGVCFYQLSDGLEHEHFPEGYSHVWGKNSTQIPNAGEGAYYAGLEVPFSLLLTADVVVKAGDLFELAFSESRDSGLYIDAYETEEAGYRELTQQEEIQEKSTVSLSGLAATARGIKRIAALRMDVDHLGLLFSDALHGKYRSLAHLATLARNLNYFFSYDIQRICHGTIDGQKVPGATDICQRLEQGASKRMVTIIYSGGDDLFLVGAWSDVPEVAIDVHKHFRQFTCEQTGVPSHERFLSISAGVTVHGPKFPLYRMSQSSEIALSLAKRGCVTDCVMTECLEDYETCYLHRVMDCQRKDSIALFVTDGLRQESRRLNLNQATKGRIGLALPFSEFDERVLSIVRQFLLLGKMNMNGFEPAFPHGFFQRLHLVTQTWRDEGYLYIPALKWALARMANTMQAMEIDWPGFSHILSEKLSDTRTMETFHQPLMWVGWLARSSGGD